MYRIHTPREGPFLISAPGDLDYDLLAVPANGLYVHGQTFDANGASGAACDRVDTLVEIRRPDGTASGFPITGSGYCAFGALASVGGALLAVAMVSGAAIARGLVRAIPASRSAGQATSRP